MASILDHREPGAAGARAAVTIAYAPLIAATLAAVGILVAYVDTAASIVAIWWRSETFAHGFIVVPICFWLGWRKRALIAATPSRPWLPALAVVALGGALWALMSLADVLGVRQFALAFMVQAAIVAVVGLRMASVLAFPLFFLLFAIPAGEFLVPTMIDRTADFTVAALQASGVPVYREANYFIIPSGAWSVVEACSGLRYLIASLMIGVVYASVSYRSPGRRAAFIAASIVVPLVANWLRAYIIVMIGHLSNNKLAVGVDHLIYGWVFFGIVMALLFWVGSLWSQDEAEAPAAVPATSDPRAHDAPASHFYVVAVVAILLAAVWRPVYVGLERAPSNAAVTVAPIAAAGNWAETSTLPAEWTPDYSGFVARSRQGFENRDAKAGIQLLYYRDQRKGHELVTSGNQLALPKNERWRELGRATTPVTIGGRAHDVSRAELAGVRQRLVVYRLFWVDGRLTSSEYGAKALLAWSKLTGGTGDAALVVAFAQEREGIDDARAALEALWPSIERALASTRANR